jgi:hypothetical protein
MRDQTPLFLPEPVQIVPAEHKSNPLGAEFEMILREGKKFVLTSALARLRGDTRIASNSSIRSFVTLTSSATRIAFRFVTEFLTAFLPSTFSNTLRIRAAQQPKFCVF